MRSVGYAPAIVRSDNTRHSQHHGTEPPVHTHTSLSQSPHLTQLIPFSLSLSLSLYLSISLSLYLYLSISLYLYVYMSISLYLYISISLNLSISLYIYIYLSLSLPLPLPLALSLSPFLSIYVSLWLQDTCHMMPFTKQHSAYAWVVTCILFLINLTFHNLSPHSSYTIHQPFTHSPTTFYDYHTQSYLKNIFFASGPTVV